MKKISVFVQLATLLFVLGFSSFAQAQLVVKLSVSPNEDELIATTKGRCKKQPNNPGCLRASGKVNINFNLTGNPVCSSGGRWELDHVALGNGNKAEPGNISEVAARDFDAVRGTGRVNAVNQSPRHILLGDNNSEAYDIWYTVVAVCTGSGATIATDPRIENDGTGHIH